MGIQFSFLHFQPWRVDFDIGLAVPPKFAMIFELVGTITFDTLGPLNFTRERYVTLFPTIFTLWNAWVYVSFPNGHNIPSNIETSVN